MEHIAALLLIVACSDGFSTCRERPAPKPIFETAEECNAELAALMPSLAPQEPQILAKCVTVDPALDEEDVELTWKVDPDGSLRASLGVPDMVVVTGSVRREKD